MTPMRILFALPLLLLCATLSAQEWSDIRFRASFQPGMSYNMLPTMKNVIAGGDESFEPGAAHTIGFDGKVDAWPVHSPYFGYGYSLEISKGWGFEYTHTLMERGHHAFIGLPWIQAFGELLVSNRETFGYMFNAKKDNERLNYSPYQDIRRHVMGLLLHPDPEMGIEGAFILEKHPAIPGLGNRTTAFGGRLGIWRDNSLQIQVEGIVNQPVYGVKAVSATSTIEKTEGFFLRLRVIKRFDYKSATYKSLFSGLF